MSDEQKDAALIAKYRERLYTAKDGVMMFEFENAEHEPVEVDETDAAMLRTIDRLQAELEATTAQLKALRNVCEIERIADLVDDYAEMYEFEAGPSRKVDNIRDSGYALRIALGEGE
jgi:hypothetical protein